MLKITYTDDKLNLDLLKQSLEDWINTRVVISVRSSTSIYIESSTASVLLPVDSFTTNKLQELNSKNIVELCPCDAESVEVVLKGIWLTSKAESETGLFVTELDKPTELLLQQLFNRELFCHA